MDPLLGGVANNCFLLSEPVINCTAARNDLRLFLPWTSHRSVKSCCVSLTSHSDDNQGIYYIIRFYYSIPSSVCGGRPQNPCPTKTSSYLLLHWHHRHRPLHPSTATILFYFCPLVILAPGHLRIACEARRLSNHRFCSKLQRPSLYPKYWCRLKSLSCPSPRYPLRLATRS